LLRHLQAPRRAARRGLFITFRTTVAIAILLATPGAAFAAGSATGGLTALGETNLIVLGNLTGGHDVEGKTYVGGNIGGNASTYGIGRGNQGEAVSARPTLTVGGNINGGNFSNGSNGGSGTVAARKSIDIGGSFTGGNFNVDGALIRAGSNLAGFNINGGTDVSYGVNASGFHNVFPVKDATLAPGGANDLHAKIAAQTATLDSDLKALSTALGGIVIASNPSSYFSPDVNTNRFIARDSGLGFAVINITAGQLSAANNFSYDIPAVGGGFLTTIINVTGASSYTLNANSNLSAYNPYVLWNFGTATSITLNRQFNGTLLAPFATVSNSTPIEGSVAVANFNQGGEVHLGTFKPNAKLVSFLTPGASTGVVPEPAVWAQLIMGFGLAGSVLRRRRGVAAQRNFIAHNWLTT
jgi:choice-of-anchor A domain-containing protein